MKCDIGHFEIKSGGRCYNLIPSFENIMKLGNAEELVEVYNSLHWLDGFPDRADVLHDAMMYNVQLSARVIRACSDIDPSPLLIDVIERGDKFKMKIGTGIRLSIEEQVNIAAGLIRHGVAGVSKVKSNAPKGKAATEVDLWEFVHTAMAHLEMSKRDALSLTMTEFVRIMETKYPREKNIHDEISDEAYDNAMARMREANAKRDKK